VHACGPVRAGEQARTCINSPWLLRPCYRQRAQRLHALNVSSAVWYGAPLESRDSSFESRIRSRCFWVSSRACGTYPPVWQRASQCLECSTCNSYTPRQTILATLLANTICTCANRTDGSLHAATWYKLTTLIEMVQSKCIQQLPHALKDSNLLQQTDRIYSNTARPHACASIVMHSAIKGYTT
jgi:hypothetical protein